MKRTVAALWRGAPWQRSLRARLVGYFLLLSALTVAIVGAVVYGRATNDLQTSVFDRLSAVADNKADALDRWIDEQRRTVVFVGSIAGFGDDARVLLDPATSTGDRGIVHDRLASALEVAIKQISDAQEFLLLDLEGTIVVSTRPEHEGKSQANEAFFTEGISHGTVQNAYTSSLTGLPTITVSNPLFDQNGKGRRVGVLAANLNLARIDDIVLARTGLGESGATYLIAPDRRFLHERLNDGLGPQGAESYAIEASLAGQTGQALYSDYHGVPVIGVYRWLDENEAALVAEMTQEEAFGPARQLALTIAVVGLLSAVVLAIGIWLIARQVTRPILRLAATAARVQAGDLDATSGVASNDEVGTLAAAFDDMTNELRENVETLERRVAERTAELNRQRSYFAALVEVSPVAIVTMDREELVSAWNPAATTLFGYRPKEAIGQHIDDLILRSDDLREAGHELARQAAEYGNAHQIGQRMRKDGTFLDAEIVMVPLVVDGEHLGFYAIYHDITELQAARRDADAANQAKSAFLAAMSHEIRTPMNAVIGMSGLLLDTSLNDEQRDYTETINTSGEALLTIINDILDFSKIEAGRFELDEHPFALAATIEGALDVMGPIAARKSLELVYSLDPGLPRMLVGDAGRLRQIVLNLLSNAIKFTEAGEVMLAATGRRIDVAGSDGGAGRWEVEIAIRDTGMGIPPDRIGRLFQSFSQADASISRRYGGTGLGLAISRRLAELMDGSLVAESSGLPGEGSTFRLMVRVPASTEVPDEAEAPLAVLADRRVLVVDDNATNLGILVAQLEALGLTVYATVSATEARDKAIAANTFDLVLTDLLMPDMDGLSLAAAIDAANAPRKLPVIVLSSPGQREREAEAVAAFLTKPVKPAALKETVVRVLTGEVAPAAPRIPERSAIDAELARRHPLRVLLAEDNAVNQKLALRLLARMGYMADLATNGIEAIDALERRTYDLVLMDVQMPELSGLEATRQIRDRWPERAIHIVAMTANAMEGDRETCLAAGMNDYVSKPIRPEELAAALLAAPSATPTMEAS